MAQVVRSALRPLWQCNFWGGGLKVQTEFVPASISPSWACPALHWQRSEVQAARTRLGRSSLWVWSQVVRYALRALWQCKFGKEEVQTDFVPVSPSWGFPASALAALRGSSLWVCSHVSGTTCDPCGSANFGEES